MRPFILHITFCRLNLNAFSYLKHSKTQPPIFKFPLLRGYIHNVSVCSRLLTVSIQSRTVGCAKNKTSLAFVLLIQTFREPGKQMDSNRDTPIKNSAEETFNQSSAE